MYKIIDETGIIYTQYTYTKELDFERMIVANSATIFGEAGIYFDIKKLIGTPKKGATIPDCILRRRTAADAELNGSAAVTTAGHLKEPFSKGL